MKKNILFYTLFLLMVCFSSCTTNHRSIDGKSLFITDWEFQYQGQWYPAFVPSYIHTDLLDNKLIPDPFFGTNEDSVQWVSDSCWTYRLRFDATEVRTSQHSEFVFEGVTGYAEFYLNDEPFLNQEGNNYTDNSFRTWRFAIPDNLKETDNVLIVKFISAATIIKERSAQLPYQLPDPRAFLRTPPYQGGWDWGPKLVTCGLSKPVYVNQWEDFNIQNLYIRQNSINEEEAHLIVSFHIFSDQNEKVTIKYLIDDKVVKTIRRVPISAMADYLSTELTIKNPKLWYPNGMGEQNRYKIGVQVEKDDISKKLESKIGLRTIELINKQDSIGSSFEFHVNGEALYVKGANWIPADFFPTNIKDEQYRNLLEACKESNMNMIRVWGGGIYEPDVFYDLCDELGILVWQDFMYACALYPGDSSFLHNAKMEAEEQVIRLRNHPCLAVWCGNNEVQNGWEDWGWKANYCPKHQAELDHNLHFLFDTLLLGVVKEHNSYCPYVSTSPLWGWGHPECCTEGDSHYWGVWWGELPFEMWEEKTGRFMSEYGFQSYPTMSTITAFTSESERSLNSASLKNHQKHGRGMEIINKALTQYFYVPTQLKDYVYLSQLVQAYGIGNAIEVHRRNQPHCMGTLYWQLNDCWPVASWSSIDYYGNWKALQYEAKRQFEPVIITTAPRQKNTLPIYVVNDKKENLTSHLQILLCDFTGQVKDSIQTDEFNIPAQSSTEVFQYSIPKSFKTKYLNSHYLLIKLYNSDNQLITQKIYFYLYPNELNFSREGIISQVKRINVGTADEQYEFTISSNEIKYGVAISSNIVGHYSDNYFTLLPGETKKIIFTPSRPAKNQMKYRITAFGK